jgi:cation:H+ antiporter
MESLILWMGIFILSLAILIKAADKFTEASEKIGIFFGLSPFIIGIIIVSIGTSLPELISSIFSVLKNSSEIVTGNVIGSNIANIALALGVAATMKKKMKINYKFSKLDLPLFLSSAILFAIFIRDGKFMMIEAILFLILYFAYIFQLSKTKNSKKFKSKNKLGWKQPMILLISSFLIYLGAKYTINSTIAISEILNIGKEIIAVGAIALGTSLPELTVSVNAARKGKADIAIGNILGSNIFNILMVMSIPSLFGNLVIPSSLWNFSIPVMLFSSAFFIFIIKNKEITRKEGIILILIYLLFMGRLLTS